MANMSKGITVESSDDTNRMFCCGFRNSPTVHMKINRFYQVFKTILFVKFRCKDNNAVDQH